MEKQINIIITIDNAKASDLADLEERIEAILEDYPNSRLQMNIRDNLARARVIPDRSNQ